MMTCLHCTFLAGAAENVAACAVSTVALPIGKGKHPGETKVISTPEKSLLEKNKQWGLDKNRASEAQRIGVDTTASPCR
jgi:hypothetical protein